LFMIRICAGDPSPWLRQYKGKKPLYACILSFTETGLMPHISAAGSTPQARRYTAIADAAFLTDRLTSDLTNRPDQPRPYPLPRLKAGISPAVIARALLTQQNIPIQLLSTGLPEALPVPHIALPQVIAKSVHTGQAMSLEQVQTLFESGLCWGERLAQQCLNSCSDSGPDSYPNSYLIVGECVVGGTTTAQAVLTALGYPVAGRMSSSHANSNHLQKQALVNQGLSQWQPQHFPANRRALSAVAACGDPMQAVAAGIAISASQRVGVLLAGGSQMLAVYALAKALAKTLAFEAETGRETQARYPWKIQRIVVGTTRWVTEDKSADTQAIAQEIGAPYLASEINFSQSPYFQLRAYEQGFVKEGVGAGGCAIAAHLYQGWNSSQIRHAVEAELRRSL
jgi:uncharacterized protein (TIGR00303 family)